MKSFAQIDIDNNGEYLKLLSAISKLSGLFSESNIPFINYRIAENIFCSSFNATNLSRSDIAFDAKYQTLGIGLKTFISLNDNSREKVAEFNQQAKLLSGLTGKKLALKIAENRNKRIAFAKRFHGIENSLYHIVARREKELLLFETDYNYIDTNNIKLLKNKDSSLFFEDGKNEYSFNYSKSTLFRKFIIPQKVFKLPIEIIEDPFDLLMNLFEKRKLDKKKSPKLLEYVILPLYGMKDKKKFVFEKSGLNQWNAGGRKRDFGEVYIPIPKEIHNKFPNFFPERDIEFQLEIPTGQILKASVCQDNSKALMTNPNNALSDWLLRKVFDLKEGELATIEKMDELGFDSVIIEKIGKNIYKIDKAKSESYSDFIGVE